MVALLRLLPAFLTPGNVTLNPGDGALLESPVAFRLTFTGTPRVPVLPLQLGSGCNLVSRQTPEVGTYEEITERTMRSTKSGGVEGH